MDRSVIYTSALTIIVGQLIAFFGLPFGPDEIATIVAFLMSLGGAVIIAIRRYAQGDITVSGKRV